MDVVHSVKGDEGAVEEDKIEGITDATAIVSLIENVGSQQKADLSLLLSLALHSMITRFTIRPLPRLTLSLHQFAPSNFVA